MKLKTLLAILLISLVAAARADGKLAVLGVSEEKSLESLSVQEAVEASNSATAGALRLKPWFVALSQNAERNLELAGKVAADPEVLGVVLHGEAAADPAIVSVFRAAGLATVSASSWAQPRQKEAFVTWLCPSNEDLAIAAAVYAKREGRASQVAVVDNGAPTAAAAAKAFASRFRSLGGKVVFEGQWQGSEWGLTRTTHSLKLNWPQMIFFAGDGLDSGRLARAMQAEKELKATEFIGQPTVFDPVFFNTARTDAKRTRGFFPCPDYFGQARLAQFIGVNFSHSSPEYHAYIHYSYKKPGSWGAMLYDASALCLRAVREAQAPGSTQAPKRVTESPAATGTAQALSPAAEADLSPTAEATLAPAEAPSAPVKLPGREDVRLALLRLDGYRGIRGVVRFSAMREPTEARAMVYFAMTRVNSKMMQWREKTYGPPF